MERLAVVKALIRPQAIDSSERHGARTGRPRRRVRGPRPARPGGMGEVYRARDPRLDRDVAIKALPDAFAADPERLARFEREARLLASLNHPNIAAIYGIEEGGRAYLVLELVEGETLAERLARGPLPLDEALAVARPDRRRARSRARARHRAPRPQARQRQVAPGGAVKVLDFGLAKSAPELARAPRRTRSRRPSRRPPRTPA